MGGYVLVHPGKLYEAVGSCLGYIRKGGDLPVIIPLRVVEGLEATSWTPLFLELLRLRLAPPIGGKVELQGGPGKLKLHYNPGQCDRN